MDSALACAVQTTLKKGEAYTTVEFKVNLTRPIMPGMGEVVCEGRIVHRGRTIAVSEATLKDKNGQAARLRHRDLRDFSCGQPRRALRQDPPKSS